MSLINKLVRYRKYKAVQFILGMYGIELPPEVKIGEDFELLHKGFGTVIHPLVTIGNRVKIYHQVTIGRAHTHLYGERESMTQIVIGDDVVLFPGAKVVGGPGVMTIGRGTVVGANSVLTKSTGENEVWAGIPARKISQRPI
jgi:serine O-acetyltransferase